MVQTFARVAVWCLVVLISAGLSTGASAVTLFYDYSGTGNVNFQSDTVLDLGGTCPSPCVFSAVMTITGNGPAFNPTIPSGWGAGASLTVSDDLGDTMSIAVNTGDFPGLNHETFGGSFFASILPSALDISTLSFANVLGGLGIVDYSININLPEGVHVTPLPGGLLLFVTGLGALGLFSWRSNRKPSTV